MPDVLISTDGCLFYKANVLAFLSQEQSSILRAQGEGKSPLRHARSFLATASSRLQYKAEGGAWDGQHVHPAESG